MATVNFDFQSSGGKEIGKQFAAIAQQIDESEGSLAKLAKTLNVSEQELADLAKELGVNGTGIQKLSKYLAESTAAGQKSEQQFAAISKVVDGLKPGSFEKLQKAVVSSIADTSKAVAQVEDLADSYDKAAKSAGKAAKASGGITSTAFSKEAAADRRNTSEIARLDRQSTEKIATDDRAAQVAIAQADRISAEKQTAARTEADKQIATIQANSAKEVASFITAQDAIQREKDRALQADIAAAEQRTDKEIARINAATAKEIAADQRAFDQVEKAGDRALQERVKLIEADSAKEIARIQSDSDTLNQDRERASRERQQAQQLATQKEIAEGDRASQERIALSDQQNQQVIEAFKAEQKRVSAQLVQDSKNASAERIAASRNQSAEIIAALNADAAKESAQLVQESRNRSNERIARERNENQQVIEAFKADAQRTTAQLVQQSRNESAERIAAERRASAERQKELDRAQQEQIATFKAALSAETSTYNARLRIASTERQKEIDRQFALQEANRKARERSAARQKSEQQQAEADRVKAQSAAADASQVIGVSPQQAQRLAEQLNLNAEQLQKGLPALQALYKNGEATGESLRVVKTKFDLTVQQLNGLLGAIKGVVDSQQQTDLAAVQQKAALDFAQSLGVSRDQALALAQSLGLNDVQMKAATKAIAKLASDGRLTSATLNDVAQQYQLNATQSKELGTAIARRVNAEKVATQNALAQSKQAGLAKAADREDTKRLAALDQFASTLGMSKEAALELVQRFGLTGDQMKGAGSKLDALAKSGQLTQSELDLVRQQFKVSRQATDVLVQAIRARVKDEQAQSEIALEKKAAKDLAAAQEKAALGFAQILGQPRDQALALAKDLKLTGEQMDPAAKAIARLANEGKLTGSTLADVAEQYRLNVNQAKTLGTAIARRVQAEKQAAQDELEQSKQRQLAQRADESDRKRLAALDPFASTTGLTKEAALELVQQYNLSSDQMRGASKAIEALAESGRLTESELNLVRRQFRLGAGATAALVDAISARVKDEEKQSDAKSQQKADAALAKASIDLGRATGLSADAALDFARQLGLTADQAKSAPAVFARLAKSGVTGERAIADLATALGLPADKAAPLAQALQKEADRLDGESIDANRKRAADQVAKLLGKTGTEALDLMRQFNLTGDQSKAAAAALDGLAKNGELTIAELKRVRDTYGLNRASTVALARAISDRVKTEQKQADDAKNVKDRDAFRKAQEAAALDFAQSIGKTRDQALALAQDLGLSGDQMKLATKAIVRLAKDGTLTASTLADVSSQYQLNADQSRALGAAVADRIAAEKQAANDAVAVGKQKQLADRADAVEQKRLAALGEFAAATGLTKDAALQLAQRFGLTDTQMKGASKAIAALAESGQLTDDELQLVRQQFRLGEQATKALAQAINQRVIDEKSQSKKKAREAADAALAKASIGLGIATGKTTDEAIALAQSLSLTAEQVKAAPAAFNRLTKAGITGTQAIADLSRELGLTESQSGALVSALQSEVDRLKAKASADKSDAANAALKVASVELAQSLGVTADQVIAFANGAGLGAQELKAAVTKITSFSQSADRSDQALKTLSEGLGLNEDAARKLYRTILAQAAAAKRQAEQSKKDDAAKALRDSQEKAALEFAQAIGKPRDQALQLARDLGLTGEQMKSATKAIAKLAQSGKLTGSTLADVAEQYRLNVDQAKALGNAVGQRVTAEKRAAESALEQSNQQKLAQRADAVEQKRIAALDQFAATLGISKEAALSLAQRFGLTDTQMKGAAGKIEALAKAGQLTESELALVQQQFKISRSVTQELSQAIARRVADEKDSSAQKAQESADAALAKASIGLGVAIGKTTDETIALAQSLGLNAEQVKAVPAAFNRLTKAGIEGQQAIEDLARDVGLTADQSIALNTVLRAEADRLKAKASADKSEAATNALRVASVELAQTLGVTADQVFAFAQGADLGAKELKTAVSKIGAFVKGTDRSEQALKALAQGLGLNEAAAQKLYRRLLAEANAKTTADAQETEATKQAELARRANAEDQKRIAALSKFSEALGLGPEAARQLVDRFALTGDQMKGVATAFNRLAKAGKLTEDELAIVQQTYRVGDGAFASLTAALRDRVATEQAAADRQKRQAAEDARRVATQKALKAQYKSQQAELAAAEKADQSRALAAIEVGRNLEVSAETITRFAQITQLSGAQLKGAIGQITKSVSAGTLDQDLAGLSKGLGVSRSALQFLAKRVQKRADELAQQQAASAEAEGQAALAAAADKADRERTAALSQFARTLGLTIDQARELVDRFALTGTQMKGAGKALGQLAKAGQLTEAELELVRQQFGLGRSATAAMVTAIEARVASEKAEAQATANEAAETARRVAIQKELKARYKQQQAALEKAEKADQSRALAAIEVARTLGTSSEQLDRFVKSTQISGEGLRSAVRAIGKSVEARTLDQDLAGLSKGLKLSESAVRFLAGRLQKQADQVAAERAAQRETDGQAALAAAADEADRKRVAVLSQFAQTMGISIDAARDLIQRFGLTGEQMKGASGAIDKLAKAGRLTSEEIGLVQQRFRLSGVAIGAMVSAIDQRVQSEQQAAAATKAATEADAQRVARQKALSAEYKKQQVAAEKARQSDASLSLAAVELSASLGTTSDRLIRFAQSTDLNAKGLKAAVSQISKSVSAGTLDRDLSGLAKGLQISENAVRFLAKRIQTKADEVAQQRSAVTESEGQARLAAAADEADRRRTAALGKFADTLGLSVPAARELVDRFALTDVQMLKAASEIDKLAKQGKLTADRLEATRQSYRLSQAATDALSGAIEARISQEKSQKSQQQLGEIGAKQKADYESALAAAALRDQQRAAESAKQAAALGLSADQTDRFAKAADLGAKELRAAVTTIKGMVKSGTATDQALAQLAPGLGLSASAAKFLAKRLQSQADAATQSQEQERLKKEQKRQADQAQKLANAQARQLSEIGQKQRDNYASAQDALAKELDKQRVAAIGFGQAIGTTSDRALRYAQALGLSSTQISAVGPQIQKLLSAGDLQGALALLTNTYKLSERSARVLIDKVEQRIQSEQAAADATKQQAAAEKAAADETDRRQRLAQQEADEAKKRIDALQGFAAAVGQTPDQAIILANVLKLSSDQMRSLPKAIAQLVQSGTDTDTALTRLGESYGLQDRQLQKLTATIRNRINQEGQSRLAAGADNADRQRTAAMPGFAAATGLTEAAARELVTRFNLTGAQMQLVSGEMARLAQQGKLTDQAIALLGQRAGLGAIAQATLAAAVQQQADAAKDTKEADTLKRASLQLAQALGRTGDETIALVQSLGLTAGQVKVIGPKLAALARQGDVAELALQQLQTATGAPIAAIAQLATAIRANVVTQQESARQSGLLQETQKLSRALGLNADQALRFAQRLELTGQAIAQIDGLKKLYAQGPVSAAALDQFRQSTGLAASEFNRLAAAVRSRVALEQQAAADKQSGKDAARAGRAAAAEGRAASSIASSLDIDLSGVQRLKDEVGKSAVEIQKAIAVLNKLEGTAATADQKVELLAQSFGMTEQQSRALVDSFDRCKASAKELGQNISSAAQDLGITYGAALKLQQGLGLTSQEFEQAAQRAALLRQTGATTAEAFDALNKEFGLTREQFDQLDRAALGSQQAMQGLATAAGAVSATLITSFKSAIGVFAEFQGEIQKAGVLSGSFNTAEGRKEFSALNEEVQKLGVTTQFTSKEIAETATELIRSGFSADQAKEAIGGIVTGAIASGDSMQQLAEVTGAALNTFGLIPAASGYVNDLVVATANASPAGVEDIGEALKYVGASAANAGQPIDEVMKAFARLAAAGIKGSTAGTGMAEAYRRLSLASAGSVTQFGNLVRGNKRAVEAFKALQLNIRKADGDLKPFSVILDQVRKSTQGFAKEDQAVLMNALFGVEGGRAVQAQLGLTEQKLQEIDQSFAETSGSSKRAADQMSQGISGALVSASSTIEALQLSIGQALSPTIEYLVRLFTGFLNTVIMVFKAIPAPVQGAIGAIAGLVTVLTTAVAAAAAFRAAATALGIAQGLAAAKTVALNAALALQSGSLVNVARSLLGFNAATAASGGGIGGLGAGLASLKAGAAAVPGAMAAAGISVKALAAGLGTLAIQAAAVFAAFELARGVYEFVTAASGGTGAAKELRDGFASLDEKFKEIEAKNPYRGLAAGQSDADKAMDTLIEVNRRYEDFGSTLNSFANNISTQGVFKGLNQSFVELRAAIFGSTEVLSKYGETWGVVTYAQIEAQQAAIALANGEQRIQSTFDDGQKALIEYRNALKSAGGNTEAESVKKANAAAEESIAKLRTQVELLRKAGPDGAIALKPLEAILKSLENRNPAIRPKVDVDPEQAKAEAEKASEAVKQQVESEQFTIKGKVELEYDNAKAARKLAFDQAAGREKLAFDQKAEQDKAAFERQLNAEKATIERQLAAEKAAGESRLNAEKLAFESKQNAAKTTFESQLEQRKNQYETAAQTRKDAFERDQEAKKLAFESQVEARKRAFTAQQQEAERSFTAQQESRARAFEASQQAAKKNFETQLAAIDASKKSQFDAQRAAVDRQLQLEFAGSEEEKARLQEQFAKEDAQAARRQQLLAAVVEQERAWEEQKRQAEVAFEEQQRAAKVAFDEQQRAIEEAFKTEQQARELAFEQQVAAEKRTLETQIQSEKSAFEAAEQEKKRQFELQIQQQKQAFEQQQAAAKEAFEQQLNAKRQQLEDQLNAKKQQLEDQLSAKKLAYDQEQQRRRLAFEEQQQQKQLAFENAERAREFDHKKKMLDLEKGFKDRERALDQQAADRRAQQLKELQNAPAPKPAEPPKPKPNANPPKPKPRAKGGPVKRQDLYLVGEKGPELFTPSQDGTIIPHKPTRELMGFAGGGSVRAGETIVVGEQGAEAFVPANAQGIRVTFDTTALDQSIRNGVAALDATLKQRMGGTGSQPATMPVATPAQPANAQLAQAETALKNFESNMGLFMQEAYRQADQLRWSGRGAEADALIAKVSQDIQAQQTKLRQDVEDAKTAIQSATPPAPDAADPKASDPIKTIAANVVTIADILKVASGSAGGKPPARRMGGPVESGTAYQVGEAGPELFVPGENGRILSNAQSVQVAERAMSAGQMATVARPTDRPLPTTTKAVGPGFKDVIQAIGSVQSRLAQLGGHTFNFVTDQAPQENIYATMRAMRRALA